MNLKKLLSVAVSAAMLMSTASFNALAEEIETDINFVESTEIATDANTAAPEEAVVIDDESSASVWDGETISCVDDFIAFAKASQNGNSFSGKTIKLTSDIDFEGANFLEIAEDGTVVTDYRIPKFSGTFDGDGYTIKNFNFVVKDCGKHNIMMFSQDNMWAYIKNLNIENVTVDIKDIASQTKVTALANRINAGGMTEAAVKNVHVNNFKILSDNTTSNDFRIGGFAYYVQGSQLIAEDCSITGFEVDVNGATLVSGVSAVTKSKCDFINVDVTDAVFTIDKVTDGCVGGFTAQTQDNGTGTTFTDCDVTNIQMNIGNTKNNIGGFVSSIGAASQFYNCTATGSITCTDNTNTPSIGGFVGDLGWNGMGAPDTQHEFNNCFADVDITAVNANVGGFIGHSTIVGYPERFIPAYFNNCEATGDVKTENGIAGGFVARGDRGIFNNCSASGNAEGRIAGGFWGELYPKATAESKGGWSYDKKEVTHQDPESKSIVLDGLTVTGTVTGTEYSSDLIGYMKDVYVNEDDSFGYATPVVMKNNNTYDYNRYSYPDAMVAMVGGVGYKTLEEAFKAVTSENNVVEILENVTIDYTWDCRNTGAKFTTPVTINGNNKTLTFTGLVSDKNYEAIFKFEKGGTIKNLTVDASAATGIQRGASFTKGTACVENCTFIGNGTSAKYGVIYGEGDNNAISGVTASVKNSNFTNWSYGVSDNRNDLDAKSVEVTGNNFENSKVLLSASESIIFTDNTVTGGNVDIKSYSAVDTVAVTATGNTLDGTDGKICANPENITADNKFATPESKIGSKYYMNLKDAFAAAKDGDLITLLGDVVITEETRTHNSGSYYDGIYYIGDESFTVDLNGFTITDNGAVNDYLLNFKNDGTKANEITLKNGRIEANTNAFSAVCTSTVSTQQITINLEDVYLSNNIQNGATLKVRGGAVINVNDGTVIRGIDSYVGIEAYGATVNIYDGAEIYMDGTTSDNGCLAGVSGNGVINVYGGYGKGVSGGFIAMTSGGTINVYGGEWIANNGAYGEGNKAVLIAQSENGAKSVINVEDGKFTGGYNCYGNAVGDAQINISGGTFSTDPKSHPYIVIPSNLEILNSADGYYTVVGSEQEAESVSVEFEEVEDKATDDTKVYNIVLKANDGDVINDLASADLTFNLTSQAANADTKAPSFKVTAAEFMTLTEKTGEEHRYMFNYNGVDKYEELGAAIVIGQITVSGYGQFSISTADSTTNAVHATTVKDNIVTTYVSNGSTTGDATKGDLVTNDDTNEDDDFYGRIDSEILVPEFELTINVQFPNAVKGNVAAYQAMKVTIAGANDTEVINLGEFDAGKEYYQIKRNLDKNFKYTVTVEGAGYRTASYTVTMTDDKVLNFWNNVMDEDTVVEEGVVNSAVKTNFLAGDIVKDADINIYDLSAAVAYFGTEIDTTDESTFAKYDLNRDGYIDSKDVAYILVSWGN